MDIEGDMKKTSEGRNWFPAIFCCWYLAEIIVGMELDNIAGIPMETINDITNYLILGALIIQIGFFQKYSKGEIFRIALFSLPVLISAAFSGFYILLSAWLFILAAKNIDFDRLIGLILRILLISLTVVIVLFLLGIIPEYTLIERRGIIRHSLGFAHPNLLGEYIFQIIGCNLYIRRGKWRVWDFVLIIPAFLFVYFIPNSQSSCMCMIILSVFLMIYVILERWKPSLLGLYRNVLVLIYIGANFFSVLFSLTGVGWSSIVTKIDKFLSIRFSACHRVFEIYGVSLFGQHVYVSAKERELVGITEKLWLDNAYMAMLIRLGIITYLFYSALYLAGMLYLKKKKQDMALIFLALYAVYSIMENVWFMAKHNFFLLLLGLCIYIHNSHDSESDYPFVMLKNMAEKFKRKRENII